MEWNRQIFQLTGKRTDVDLHMSKSVNRNLILVKLAGRPKLNVDKNHLINEKYHAERYAWCKSSSPMKICIV